MPGIELAVTVTGRSVYSELTMSTAVWECSWAQRRSPGVRVEVLAHVRGPHEPERCRVECVSLGVQIVRAQATGEQPAGEEDVENVVTPQHAVACGGVVLSR
jgi:hypothetical protein